MADARASTIKGNKIKVFDGLPKFFGGKRRFAKFILSKSKGNIFADAFLGGASVSIYAKAQNKTVLCNDISFLSEQLGRAYIENNSVKMDNDDLNRLFMPGRKSDFISEKYCPDIFTTRHSKFFDNARFWIEKTNSQTRRSLLYCFLAKFLLDVRPYGNFTTTYLSELAEQLDKCPKNKIPEHSMIGSVASMFTQPLYYQAQKIMGKVNSSVFTNGCINKFYKLDVFKFIETIRADTIYLDPPYYGATSYEEYYGVLNSCLLGKVIKSTKSKFNKDQNFDFLAKLIQSCAKFERVILSYGCEKTTPEEVLAMVKDFRPQAELYKIPHQYSVGVKDGKVPVKTEILIVA